MNYRTVGLSFYRAKQGKRTADAAPGKLLEFRPAETAWSQQPDAALKALAANHLIRMEIPVDEQAVMALQRVSTGADVHESNGLICTYKAACLGGIQETADATKRKMYERAMKLGRRGT